MNNLQYQAVMFRFILGWTFYISFSFVCLILRFKFYLTCWILSNVIVNLPWFIQRFMFKLFMHYTFDSMFNVWPNDFFCFIFQERIVPSQEPTLPPLIYSSPSDDAVDARRPSEEYSPNERNAYDLVMPGVVETGLLIFYLFRIFLFAFFILLREMLLKLFLVLTDANKDSILFTILFTIFEISDLLVYI